MSQFEAFSREYHLLYGIWLNLILFSWQLTRAERQGKEDFPEPGSHFHWLRSLLICHHIISPHALGLVDCELPGPTSWVCDQRRQLSVEHFAIATLKFLIS